MKNLRNAVVATAGLTALTLTNTANAAINVTTENAEQIALDDSLANVINGWIALFFNFLYLVAVLYGLYGGFLILTAAGDDDKVGKGKKVIINAVIGLVVIFLVGALMRWVIDLLMGSGQ